MESIVKFHAIGNSFSHGQGSCAYFPPKEKWHYYMPNSIDKYNPVVFVDTEMPNGLELPKNSKFGWLCESSAIVPHVKQWIIANANQIERSYEKVFVNDESILLLSPVFEYVPPASNMPWITEWGIGKKTDLVSIIASHKNWTEGHRLRHEIIRRFNDKVSVMGNGYRSIEKKEQGLKQFMFTFVIENAKYDLYYTEKLTDAIACGTVPIYWGSDKIGSVFNTDGFVMLDDEFNLSTITPQLYESKMRFIEENLEILRSMEPSDNMVQKKIRKTITGDE